MLRRFAVSCITILTVMILIQACAEKVPSRDEIPLIKGLLGKFQTAIMEKNRAAIDSLMYFEAVELGYSSQKILEDVYGVDNDRQFYGFGGKEIIYVDDKGSVKCTLVADTTKGEGLPAEITIIKKGNSWLVKRFDLK